jgi:hypothetical protein
MSSTKKIKKVPPRKQRKTDKANGIQPKRGNRRNTKRNPPPRTTGANNNVAEDVTQTGAEEATGTGRPGLTMANIEKGLNQGSELLGTVGGLVAKSADIVNSIKSGRGGNTSGPEDESTGGGGGGGTDPEAKQKQSPMDWLKKHWYVPVAAVVLIVGGVVLAKRKK